MNIHIIDQTDPLWLPLAGYAGTCSWNACARMATFMREGKFHDWERLIVAEENGVFMGFCALADAQGTSVPECNPLLKWLFVEEKYRGKRLSQKLIEATAGYAKTLGYNKLFLTTWHIGLYEKYGFSKIYDKEIREGYVEGVYEKTICP